MTTVAVVLQVMDIHLVIPENLGDCGYLYCGYCRCTFWHKDSVQWTCNLEMQPWNCVFPPSPKMAIFTSVSVNN